jgi:protein-disulfide isomerase
MRRQDILDHIHDVYTRARTELGVRRTPTLFINGQKYETAMTYDAFKKIVDPLLDK